MTLQQAIFIADVLGTMLVSEEQANAAQVLHERRVIAEEYGRLKRDLSFGEASRQARAAWLLRYVNEVLR